MSTQPSDAIPLPTTQTARPARRRDDPIEDWDGPVDHGPPSDEVRYWISDSETVPAIRIKEFESEVSDLVYHDAHGVMRAVDRAPHGTRKGHWSWPFEKPEDRTPVVDGRRVLVGDSVILIRDTGGELERRLRATPARITRTRETEPGSVDLALAADPSAIFEGVQFGVRDMSWAWPGTELPPDISKSKLGYWDVSTSGVRVRRGHLVDIAASGPVSLIDRKGMRHDASVRDPILRLTVDEFEALLEHHGSLYRLDQAELDRYRRALGQGPGAA